jgi:hypothetical protein
MNRYLAVSRQLTTAINKAHSVSNRLLGRLSDEVLQLLVESARQLKGGSGAVVDGDGQVITE